MRPRRTHRKSRNGCLRCINRHIKSDESRPSCLNCLRVELSCGYQPASSASSPAFAQATVSTDSQPGKFCSTVEPATISTLLSTSSAASTPPHDASSYQSSTQSGVSMLHLELLHHMSSVTCKEWGSDENKSRQAFDTGITVALGAPFLMHEILAISALHLSLLRPNQKEFYLNQAAELQTTALSFFNNLPDSNDSENSIPIFLFSSFLGMHALFDTLRFRPSEFSLFIEKFVGYLCLHRGVNTIARGAYSLIQGTKFGFLMSRGEGGFIKGNQCDKLLSLVCSADLSRASIDVCHQAVEQLQWVFDASNLRGSSRSVEDNREAGVVFAWPITISQEFTELILQKRPEALAILAHYAVLLHWIRDLWLIGDGGAFLIESVVKFLGSYWVEWLAFPISILKDANSSV